MKAWYWIAGIVIVVLLAGLAFWGGGRVREETLALTPTALPQVIIVQDWATRVVTVTVEVPRPVPVTVEVPVTRAVTRVVTIRAGIVTAEVTRWATPQVLPVTGGR